MKILSIDTASDICGVSLLEDKNILVQLDNCTGRTHSENLMPMIQKAFQETNLTLSDIDLLVCDKGPGSFTGLRIGIATVKAFQDTLSIPCIGVSSLESLAYSILEDGLIASMIDCKNDNCYFALYERKGTILVELIPPSADSVENALQTICNKIHPSKSISFIGDASIVYMDSIQNVFSAPLFFPESQSILDSYFLGLVGFEKYKEGTLEDVLPLYLKKPQAQRQLEEKMKGSSNESNIS